VCPEYRTLSAYLDGEIPSHLVESIRSHLRRCSRCQTRLERLKAVKQHLAQADHPDDRYARARVWARIREWSHQERREKVVLWRRRIELPLPLVAVAAGLFVLLGVALVFAVANQDMRMMRITTEPSGITEVQVAAPIKDLEKILQYLENQEGKKETVIRLPENSEFFVLGEPVLLRAKDMARSTF
jgi:anti-sigma factor RsiW